jgi:hypothetical protein
MRADVRRSLEELVGEIQVLLHRLKAHDQPLATQLLEMAVLEIKSRMHGIADDELQALADSLSGRQLPTPIENQQDDNPTNLMPLPRGVVALGELGRSRRKRQN